MKVGYLITTYNNYEHLERLINSLNDSESFFFIHVDKKSEMPNNITQCQNIIFIKRTKIWWGGWSHQLAILNLMKASVKYDLNYYSLISGTDYPIRPKSFFLKKLREGGEYFSLIGDSELTPESKHERYERLKYYYFDCFDRRNYNSLRTNLFLNLEKKIRKVFIKQKFPAKEIYHGPTWWTLSHSCVTYILDFLKKNKRYTKFYKSSFCAEESLIHTIIGNSAFKDKCKGYLTYANWSEQHSGPDDITLEHLILLENQYIFEIIEGKYTPYFARKFNDKTWDLVNIINTKLRN